MLKNTEMHTYNIVENIWISIVYYGFIDILDEYVYGTHKHL